MTTKIKGILILIFLQISILGFSSEIDTLRAPKNAIILSETIKESGIYYTMVDLQNNELVIVYYFFHNLSGGMKLQTVQRTGIIVDIERQTRINVNITKEADK
jgi:hypothetical protein